MLARIQTLYLFLVVLSVALSLQVLPFWTYEFRSTENTTALQTLALTGVGSFDLSGTLSGTLNGLFWGFNILLILTGITALAAILLFKNRKLQRTLAFVGLLDSIATLALGISAAILLRNTLNASELYDMPGAGFYLLVLTPVWFWLAASGIKKDEGIATAYKRL